VEPVTDIWTGVVTPIPLVNPFTAVIDSVVVTIPDVLIEIVVDNPLAVPVTSPVRLPSKLVAATTISSLGTGSS